MKALTRITLGGDLMLGRLMRGVIANEGPDYPLGKVAPIFGLSDLCIVNLECAITDYPEVWHNPKAFYFGAPSITASILKKTGVDLVSLANNHTLDYEVQGLFDTLKYLKQQHIIATGAGKNFSQAHEPALIKVNNIKFGMVAFCDHQADFAATKKSPGIAFLDLNNQSAALAEIQLGLDKMIKANVDWPILSLHWGPNMVQRPSREFVRFAHNAIDMGYKMLFGHSAHVFHGVEIYRNCPIFYSTGDLIDDYYVDPEFKNDHQLIFELELKENQLQQIRLYPIVIENFQTKIATGEQFKFISQKIKDLCKELGTTVREEQQTLSIVVPHGR